MLANELHPSKALSPMVVTESGMVTVFTAVLSTPHFSHEHSRSVSHEYFRDTIVVVPSGMLKCPSWTLTAAILPRQPTSCGYQCTHPKECAGKPLAVQPFYNLAEELVERREKYRICLKKGKAIREVISFFSSLPACLSLALLHGRGPKLPLLPAQSQLWFGQRKCCPRRKRLPH